MCNLHLANLPKIFPVYYIYCMSLFKVIDVLLVTKLEYFVHFYWVFEYNRRLNTIGDCILKESQPGMIVFLSTLFVQAGVSPTVYSIEQICRCPGEKSNAPNLCHKLPKLLNYAIYDKMTCMLHHHLFAVTIPQKRIFEIRIRNTFFAAFLTRQQHPSL